MGGPAWLGIGAQRSGTTWFTDLLLQHPQMTLSKVERKELHRLNRPSVNLKAYRRLFEGCAGECTPYYMRSPSAPARAARVLGRGAVVLVLLRDPVDRFASAMSHYESRKNLNTSRTVVRRLVGSDATWGGMYAAQLQAWERDVGAERIMVMQYEALRADPQACVDRVWRRLGLDPVPLENVQKPSSTASTTTWTWPAGLEDALTSTYLPEVRRLQRWGIDLDLWPHFAARPTALTRGWDALRRQVPGRIRLNL